MSESDELVRQAIASFQAGKLDDAELRFKELLRREPDHLAALNIMSIILTILNRYSEAETYVQSALNINSKSDATYYNYGVILKALNRPNEALERFNQALAINASDAETWNNRGTVFNDLKRYDDAIADFNKAIELQPNYSGAFYNKGKSLSGLKRYDEALALYNKALALNPGLAEAWNGRGSISVVLKRHNDALVAYDKALALKPNFAEAWIGRGNVSVELKRYDEALVAYDKALALNADLLGARFGRAQTLTQMKRIPDAIAAYRDALNHGGNSEQIKYLLAALGAEPPPAVSPQGYIADLFDEYAYTFDRHLIDDLKYQTPAFLAGAIKRIVSSNTLDILDLGCGTGLVGEALSSLKRTLTGIDLSENMLKHARQRGIYDHLIHGEIVQSLQIYDSAFDIVVAAEVFIYVGDLSPVFHGVRRALRDGGIFCFSVEAINEGDFVLRGSLRYAHSIDYIQRTAKQNRFVVETIESHTIRQEAGADGYLVTLRCSE